MAKHEFMTPTNLVGNSHNPAMVSGLGDICVSDLYIDISRDHQFMWSHSDADALSLDQNDGTQQIQKVEENGQPFDPAADKKLNAYDSILPRNSEHNFDLALVDIDGEQNIETLVNGMDSSLKSQPLVLDPKEVLTVGREFSDVHSCRRALREAAIALRFEMQTVKSDKTRFTAKCATEECPWRVHAAKLPGLPTFTIRTVHETHTCGGIDHLGHQQASVQWVADTVAERLKENPCCKPKELLEEIHRVHGITLTYKQAWRGKERIMATLRGSCEEDYRLLPQYCDQISRSNPGSIAIVSGDPVDDSFRCLFISFEASIYGFLNACRPLIGLDKTPLKSKYPGNLLIAAGFDGDGSVFPLAFGIVNDCNWEWFLFELHHLLEINSENMPKLTILSNREKVLVDAVEATFPTAFHGYCMHYLVEAYRKQFNSPLLVNLLWEAAYALTQLEFQSKLFEIEQISQEAGLWIQNIPPDLWAAAYFQGKRFGHLTANIVELLHDWLDASSGLPVIQMMECIRRHLMTCFNARREMSMGWTGMLVPCAERHVSEVIEQAHGYQVLNGNEAEFQVVTLHGNFFVDIRNRTCMCSGWQLSGLPCPHAAAALLSCRQTVCRFTESYFTVANYQKAYSRTIHPIPDKALWSNTLDVQVVIKPPMAPRPPGKPRKRRARSEDTGRVKRAVHCSRCNKTGHFRTTCTAPL